MQDPQDFQNDKTRQDATRGFESRSHFHENNGWPGQARPGRMNYPLTRSTRATTALARNWAMMALRCFRSYTSRSMVSSVKSGDRRDMLILSILPSCSAITVATWARL